MLTISTFTGPISTVAVRVAEKRARQQATPEKSQQVLLNTLSVFFVKFYLECMGFETDLEASESWNPAEQTLTDVADLFVKNCGKLECRPVLEDAEFVYVPPEVQSNRIGYIVVQINKSLQSANLLGFIKEVSIDEFPIEQLQPLEFFLDYLEQLELQNNQLNRQETANLKQWLENIYESNWLPIESIFSQQIAWQFRSHDEREINSVSRAKLINLGIKGNGASVGIVVKVSPDENDLDEMNIIVELHPTNGQEYLPPSLGIMILDEEETAVMEALTKNDNQKISLEFNAAVGDSFGVKIVWRDITVTENFML
ncbi:DUF1822 family protein [Limnoraphis robusta Tam1]|uniref:DUF1822 family protein n=1 Tax=Limnoraphis robusta CCNP1315 TaxID=3110306 RepID=A0ABU5TV77_9CYAN|nr:DUF1822 family protein [Limnoraphis robusta]MEA5495901.1 DUF1822 family protein [Limnoraphis robusta BA-68 BA1]MEA5518799.1 DUF1822 family protein [Limnoraphis robusta CCNP1315]MEA5542548.1 DUF1822 family protein [Limnoraphis robusta Tam1]MEA5547580.1 DUF1822 family protein [Limnoraphis robusta CCNP1324]